MSSDSVTMRPGKSSGLRKASTKLGTTSGVFVPVFLNIVSILMFLRFGLILGVAGLSGIFALLATAYAIDLLTTLSLSAIASNGEVKGGGAYYMISRCLGPEFGGSIGILFYLSQVLSTALNVVGLMDCIAMNAPHILPHGYWSVYALQTICLIACTALCLAGSGMFAKAGNGLLIILSLSIISIPISATLQKPFVNPEAGITFTGFSFRTLADNFFPDTRGSEFTGIGTFRELFAILFPATSGIFAGASMSGDLKHPSKAIPKGTLWAMFATFLVYLMVVVSMAASTTRDTFLANENVISETNLLPPIILAGECATTIFSSIMGLIGSAKLLQALARDRLVPGLSMFGQGTRGADEPINAILLTYALTQISLFADLDQIAALISMGFQMTFFVMNLACFLLKIGSAPNFRPAFKFFNWQTAFAGALTSAAAMFFIDESYTVAATCLLIVLFLLIHYLSPPKRWGDVSQNLIYHQVRKYLLRLKPEHIKFWRPQIILLINDPRHNTRLIQFCNSMKKGGLYILGHVIVTDDFDVGVHEARLQQNAWTNYISEVPSLKAFVQLIISPSINWGVRNLILSAGLGGMRPNIAVLGFYNMDDLRRSQPSLSIPCKSRPRSVDPSSEQPSPSTLRKRRVDTSARLLQHALPTDIIRTENMISATAYMTMLEDLALKYKLNVGVGKGFEGLETPRRDAAENTKKYIDLWPIQMSAELVAGGKSILTTNFDTYTLILQLGCILRSVPAWRAAFKLRVLVFVEYESEVEEERARVKALLEKLRIEAEILVFWLANGQLQTYELIINGKCSDEITNSMVDTVLRDDAWWDELKALRGRSSSSSSTRELDSFASIMDATTKKPGIADGNMRQPNLIDLRHLQTNPTVTRLSRLGVNVGIHTHRLADGVFGDRAIGEGELSDASPEPDSSDSESAASDGDIDDQELSSRTFFSSIIRRKSHGDALGRASLTNRSRPRRLQSKEGTRLKLDLPSYGTIQPDTRTKAQNTSEDVGSSNQTPRTLRFEVERPHTASSSSLEQPGTGAESSAAGKTPVSARLIPRKAAAVRFSSKPVPETRIVDGESQSPTIMFADSKVDSPPRPKSSFPTQHGQLPSQVSKENDIPKTAEEGSSQPSPQKTSLLGGGTESKDASLDIAEIRKSQAGNKPLQNTEAGAPYSTQNVALSFNDLPSRAQHLIINELMRQNSQSTAVLYSTLPIPAEGTGRDEAASIQYLSDVEILCDELPPILLVLSNSMTVTVSL